MSLPASTFRYEFGDHDGGALVTTIAGAQVVCRASGALWLQDEGALVVADLHFEKGSAYAARGQMLPPYDTGDTLTRLEAEVVVLQPRRLVFLGDSFHDGEGESRLAPGYVDRLRTLASGRTLVWIVGNHDADGPRALPGERAAQWETSGLSFIHEPSAPGGRGQVAGHLHPCARIRGRIASVRRRCFVTDGDRLILPAFGAYAGGLNVLDAAFRGLFSRPPLTLALGAARVHAVGWRSLRPD